MIKGHIDFTLPTRVTFGSGKLAELGEEIARCSCKRVAWNANSKTNLRVANMEEVQALFRQAFIVE